MKKSLWWVRFLSAALALGAGAAHAVEADFPTKPVRIIVPFATGGTTDIIARVVALKMSTVLKQQVLVENKAGAGGLIGADEVAKAVPDGYTLGLATVSSTATNPATNVRVKYNPVTDFTPIINLAETPNVIAVNPGKIGARTYQDFLTLLKDNPEKFNYSSSGKGGIGHMQMEMFKNCAKTRVTHIPYKGAGPALIDTVAGQVDMIFDNYPSTKPFLMDKRLIPIVVASPTRVADFPNVPTFAEIGCPEVNRVAYYGLLGPKGMPTAIVDKLNAAAKAALADPEVRRIISEERGATIVGGTPKEFAAQIKSEFEVYSKLATDLKISLDE